MGITSPAPTAAKLEEINKDTYDGERRGAVYASRLGEFDKRYCRCLADISTFVRGGRLLDVGANIGLFVKAANLAGFEAAGVELNDSCAAYGRARLDLDIRTSSLEGAAFPDDAFDAVTMFDVLEHVPNPGGFLDEARRILKPGGLLVVQCPNLNSLMADLLKENWNWLATPDHLYHFTPRALTRLLENRGFRVATLRTWEPAKDFTGNIYSGFPAHTTVGRALKKLLWLFSLILVPLFQYFWWKTGKGGLIKVYAVKEPYSL